MVVTYQAYHNSLDELFRNLDMSIQGGCFEDARIVIFGTNIMGGVIADYLTMHGYAPEAIIDSRNAKHGKYAYGLRIHNSGTYLKPYDDRFRIVFSTYAIDGMITFLEQQGYRLGRHILMMLDATRAGSDYHFLDRSDNTPITMEEEKESMLHSLAELDRICTEEGLRYYLAGGTLLGAIRHQGFIPWDDDMDIRMPLKDIVKLTELMEQDASHTVISLANKSIEYFDTLSYFTDNSILCDYVHFPQHTAGFPIDLFPTIGVPADEEERTAYFKELKHLETQGWIHYREPEKRRALAEKMLEKMLQYDCDQTEFVTCGHAATFMEPPTARKWFDETIRVPFEHLMVPVVKEYDAYLRAEYGDYMQLPPENKRSGGHGHHAYRPRVL